MVGRNIFVKYIYSNLIIIYTTIVNGVEDEEEMDCDSIEHDCMFHVFIEWMQD